MASDDARLHEPISDERLAEITRWVNDPDYYFASCDDDSEYMAISDLLAEVKRLRAREAAMVAIVEHVAETAADFDMNTGNSWLLFPGLYAAEKCREQARALLASTETAAS